MIYIIIALPVPDDPVRDWTVSLDCSQQNIVTVAFTDYIGSIRDFRDIYFSCTDGNAQVVLQWSRAIHRAGTELCMQLSLHISQ